MGKALSPAAIERFHRDGYFFPIRVFSGREIAACRGRLKSLEHSLGGPLWGKYRIKCHLLSTCLSDIIRHPAILDAIEDLIGPDILCWQSIFFIKEANSNHYVSWHQDAIYWGLSSHDVVSAWVAFTESRRDNGAMRVIPGSHKRLIAHVDTFAERNQLSRGEEIAADVDEARAVDIVLRPGEISLHHVLMIHASGPNRTDERRIGFAIRYIPTHVQQTSGEKDSATLVRGTDAHGHFDLEPTPARDLDPAMLEIHADAADRKARIIYKGTDVMSAEASSNRGKVTRRI